jgi:hypothetical protein
MNWKTEHFHDGSSPTTLRRYLFLQLHQHDTVIFGFLRLWTREKAENQD